MWQAIARRNAGDPVPNWCELYLSDAALALTQLAEGNTAQALKLVPQALGLGKQGQNQFDALQKDRDQLTEAAMATTEISSIAKFMRQLGLDTIMKKHSVEEDRAQRLLARGKRLRRDFP